MDKVRLREETECNDIGANTVCEARVDLFATGSTTQNVPLFQDQHLAASLGQICSADQAIVPATYNDRIVSIAHHSS